MADAPSKTILIPEPTPEQKAYLADLLVRLSQPAIISPTVQGPETKVLRRNAYETYKFADELAIRAGNIIREFELVNNSPREEARARAIISLIDPFAEPPGYSGEPPVPLADYEARGIEIAHLRCQVDDIASALRAFPQFDNDAEITGDAIRDIARDYVKMVCGWGPIPTEIEFVDQDGQTHKIVYADGESEAGIDPGWAIPEDAGWKIVRDIDPKAEELAKRLRALGQVYTQTFVQVDKELLCDAADALDGLPPRRNAGVLISHQKRYAIAECSAGWVFVDGALSIVSDLRRDAPKLLPEKTRDFKGDLDYLGGAEAHCDEGPLGEGAARSILDIALYWMRKIAAEDLVHLGWAITIRELQAAHDARVTELLSANNREVERRRKAEAGMPRRAVLKSGEESALVEWAYDAAANEYCWQFVQTDLTIGFPEEPVEDLVDKGTVEAAERLASDPYVDFAHAERHDLDCATWKDNTATCDCAPTPPSEFSGAQLPVRGVQWSELSRHAPTCASLVAWTTGPRVCDCGADVRKVIRP